MDINQGYPPVPADLVVNYFVRSAADYPEQLKFLQEHNIRTKDMIFAFPRPKVMGLCKREQFQIPNAAFCVGIAGNRLICDCTDEVCDMLKYAMRDDPDICLVFMGEVSEELGKRIQDRVDAGRDRIFFLGFQEQIEETLEILDLYVDLPHQGGEKLFLTGINIGKQALS